MVESALSFRSFTRILGLCESKKEYYHVFFFLGGGDIIVILILEELPEVFCLLNRICLIGAPLCDVTIELSYT